MVPIYQYLKYNSSYTNGNQEIKYNVSNSVGGTMLAMGIIPSVN